MVGTNSKGNSSSQDRARQPKRAGGNSAEYGIEAHGQKRATKIGICGIGGVGTDTGRDSSWGAQRDCGGNTAHAPIEKHGQPKSKGNHFVGGKRVGDSPNIPQNIQVSERRHGAGNEEFVPSLLEKPADGVKKVSASRRFKS
jgi:hypothetical protein